MCGRYYIDDETSKELSRIIKEIEKNSNKPVKTGEIFPSETVPILVAKKDIIVPVAIKWGMPGFNKAKLIINARSESVIEKKMFRESILHRRCIIPANGFYEWSHSGKKIKYYFSDIDSDTIYMGGIYNTYQGEDCAAILTTNANQSMNEIHDRMPLLLTKNQIETWLMDEKETQNILSEIPMELQKDMNLEKPKEFEQITFDFFQNSK